MLWLLLCAFNSIKDLQGADFSPKAPDMKSSFQFYKRSSGSLSVKVYIPHVYTFNSIKDLPLIKHILERFDEWGAFNSIKDLRDIANAEIMVPSDVPFNSIKDLLSTCSAYKFCCKCCILSIL